MTPQPPKRTLKAPRTSLVARTKKNDAVSLKQVSIGARRAVPQDGPANICQISLSLSRSRRSPKSHRRRPRLTQHQPPTMSRRLTTSRWAQSSKTHRIRPPLLPPAQSSPPPHLKPLVAHLPCVVSSSSVRLTNSPWSRKSRRRRWHLRHRLRSPAPHRLCLRARSSPPLKRLRRQAESHCHPQAAPNGRWLMMMTTSRWRTKRMFTPRLRMMMRTRSTLRIRSRRPSLR